MNTDLKLPSPGDRVTVAAHEHSIGKCFLAGSGVVVENLKPLSRARGELIVRFDHGVTGVFGGDHLATLLS